MSTPHGSRTGTTNHRAEIKAIRKAFGRAEKEAVAVKPSRAKPASKPARATPAARPAAPWKPKAAPAKPERKRHWLIDVLAVFAVAGAVAVIMNWSRITPWIEQLLDEVK